MLITSRGESLSFVNAVESLRAGVPLAEAVLLSTMPHGGLQVLQVTALSDNAIRTYHRHLAADDALSWSALLEQTSSQLSTLESDSPARRLIDRDGFAAHGLAHAVAVPVSDPLLDGYPGVLQVWRGPGEADFSAQERAQIAEFAKSLSVALVKTRRGREGEESPVTDRQRLFVFDGNGQLRFPADPGLDRTRLDGLAAAVKQLLASPGDEPDQVRRVPVSDARGETCPFNLAYHRAMPALGSGPVVIAAEVPEPRDWQQLRQSDFSADPELSRLVPVMRYVEEKFAVRPTLTTMAQVVNLSPFHFHRRFAELLGITPKHFLYDAQIARSRTMLRDRTVNLVEIARACGFAHQSHFTSRFKQATGLTPSRYRSLAATAATN